jgi:uncharacterized protein YegL
MPAEAPKPAVHITDPRSPRVARGRHRVVLGGCAFALSVVFHAAMFELFPPVRMGRPDNLEQAVRYPAIQLHDVVQRMTRREKEPARFRPEDPQQTTELLGTPTADDTMAGVDLPIPPPPDVPGVQGGEGKAMAAPSQQRNPEAWDPRQDIVKIDDRVLADEASLLPRRYIDAAPRADRVPDVVLPVESPDPAGLSEFAMGTGGAGSAVSAGEGPRYMAVGRGEAGGEIAPPEARILEETRAQVTRAEPVEQYLDLDTLVFSPPEEPGVNYFELRIRRHGEEALPVLPKDVLLLQDCSESMTAAKLIDCKRGLRQWLDTLDPADRFEIIGFRDSVSRCFDAWQAPTDARIAQAVEFIEGLRAEGNTDVYGSLQAALAVPRDASRPLIVVLVSDGRPTTGVTGSSDIIERFTRDNAGRISMFTVGGGKKVNRFLLDLISYRNRGDSLIVPVDGEVPSAMAQQSAQLRRPVLTDLDYHFTGIPEEDVFPRSLTHLYLDRSLVLYGRYEGVPTAAFQIVGRSGEAVRDIVFPLDPKSAQPGSPDIRTRWAWQKAYHLIGRHLQTQDASLLDEIRALADDYGLALPYGYGRGVPMW